MTLGTPYAPVNIPRRMMITAALMLAATNTPTPGVDSTVAEYRVPDGTMLVLLHDQPARLFLQARHEVGRVASSGDTPVTVTVQVTGDGRVLQRTTRTGRPFPALNHPDVIAYTQATGQPWKPARVLAVNWQTGAVDVEAPQNAGKVRVYYTFGDGEVILKAGRPFGSSSGQVQIWRGSARGLHETDQQDRDAAVFTVRAPMPLPQGFTLALVVRATSAVYLDGLAQHEINIPASDTAITVSDPVALADLAERQLKGG